MVPDERESKTPSTSELDDMTNGRMRYLTTVALVCCSMMSATASFAGDNALTDAEKAAGWQLLFNGKDLSGWKCNNGKDIATPIEDGALVPYKSGGYLIVHEKQFGDFVLKCDVKMGDPDCNSGIFFRVGNLKNPVYTGLEVQVFSSTKAGYHDFGAIYDLVKPSHVNLHGEGEWNHVVLACRGPLITVVVNGEVVAMMDCDDFPEKGRRPDGSKHKFGVVKDLPRIGYLGFQDHGHKVWIKNVKILELK